MKKFKREFNYQFILQGLGVLILIFLGLIIGLVTHEIIGHGLTGIIVGGNLDRICILALNVNSTNIFYEPCIFGRIWLTFPDNTKEISYAYFTLMASPIMLLISIAFSFIILLGNYKGIRRIIFSILALYFIDPLFNSYSFFINKIRANLNIIPEHFNDVTGLFYRFGVDITPLIIIYLFSTIITCSIISYKLFCKKNKLIEKVLLWLMILVILMFLVYIIFIFPLTFL